MTIRKQRRFSTSAALYIPLGVLLIVFLFIFGISVFLRIIEIEVTGASEYTAEDICEASGIALGDNMLFMDEKAIERSIRLDKPYVKEVKIIRLPPSAIQIKVTESKALATINYQDGIMIIDADCRVLKLTDSKPEGLIEIRGFLPDTPIEGSTVKAQRGSDTSLEHLRNTLEAIEKVGIEKDVSYLDISSISKIKFGYLGRFKMILGTVSNVTHRLSLLPDFITGLENTISADDEWNLDMSGQYINEWRLYRDF